MMLKGCLVALSFALASPLFELEGMETDDIGVGKSSGSSISQKRKKKTYFLCSLGKLKPLIHHKTCNVCALTDRSWLCMAYVMSHTQITGFTVLLYMFTAAILDCEIRAGSALQLSELEI